MHLLADWLLWKIAKLEAKPKPSRIISDQPYLSLWQDLAFFPIKYCLLTQFKSHSDNFIKGQPKYHKFTSVSCYRMAILVLLLLVFTIYIHIIKCHPHLGARLINFVFCFSQISIYSRIHETCLNTRSNLTPPFKPPVKKKLIKKIS